MAITKNPESNAGSPIATLTGSTDKEKRRAAALVVVRNYLTAEGSNIIDLLEYPESSQDYLRKFTSYIDLQHTYTSRGLSARPSRDVTSTGPQSLIESPVPGVAEHRITLPGNLRVSGRGKIPQEEIEALVKMGDLRRLTFVDPSLLVAGDTITERNRLVKALHQTESLPQFGLKPESWWSRLAAMTGRMATFSSTGSIMSDLGVTIIRGSEPNNELWRPLPIEANGLHVFGRVPQYPK